MFLKIPNLFSIIKTILLIMTNQLKQPITTKKSYPQLHNITQFKDSSQDTHAQTFRNNEITLKDKRRVQQRFNLSKLKGVKRQSTLSIKDFYTSFRKDNSVLILNHHKSQQQKTLIEDIRPIVNTKENNMETKRSFLIKTKKQSSTNTSKSNLSNNTSLLSRNALTKIVTTEVLNTDLTNRILKQKKTHQLKHLDKNIFSKQKKSLKLVEFGIFSQKKDDELFLKKFKEELVKQFKEDIDVENQGDILRLQFVLLRQLHLSGSGSWI